MRRTALLIAGIALLGGCDQSTSTETTAALELQVPAASRASAASVQTDLATLRRVTAPFHDFEQATAAGWSVQITACMTDPTAGGMGFHYGNVALIDGSVAVDQPELLLYEPEQNGRLSLVAVEYIIPYTAHSRSATPPVLFGQEFQQNDTFQLWGLHAWVWKHNPSGMFASWNPQVTCEHTTNVSAMAHP
jgi:hypothetical protein